MTWGKAMWQEDQNRMRHLARQRVIEYACGLMRNQAAFYNLAPPTTQEIQNTVDWLRADDSRFGQIYLKSLEKVLDERAVELKSSSRPFSHIPTIYSFYTEGDCY